MKRPTRGIASASRLAWGVPLLLLLVAALIYLTGAERAPEGSPLVVVERASSHQWLRLGNSATVQGARDFGAMSETEREGTRQALSRYRAAYNVVGPRVAVTYAGGERAREAARSLGELLARYNLGHYQSPAEAGDLPDRGRAGIRLFCARADEPLAHDLLRALSGALHGEVFLGFDDSLGAGRMLLVIGETQETS